MAPTDTSPAPSTALGVHMGGPSTTCFEDSAVWWGDPEQSWCKATFEGGDITPVGNGVVLMGMSERTSRQAITQVARALFDNGAVRHVIVADMPKLRCAVHLDTVFTFADRAVVTLHPRITDAIHAFSLRPNDKAPGVEITDKGSTPFVDVVAESLGFPSLRVIEADGDAYVSDLEGGQHLLHFWGRTHASTLYAVAPASTGAGSRTRFLSADFGHGKRDEHSG